MKLSTKKTNKNEKKVENSQSNDSTSISVQTNSESQEQDLDTENKYGKTIYKIAGKNTLCEFTTNGFNLFPKDSKGNKKELSCYVSMNFVEYDSHYQQTKYIPFYLRSINWRGLKMDFQSGYFDKLAEAEIKKGKQYADPIYSFNGGTKNGPKGKPVCRILNITPAKKEGNFLLVAVQGEGEVQNNGTIMFKKGTQQTRITISVSHSVLGGILEEVSAFIPTNY